MRIKLSVNQLNELAKKLPLRSNIGEAQLCTWPAGNCWEDMHWDETGLSKLGNSTALPARVTFSAEAKDDSFICDIHPALVQYI